MTPRPFLRLFVSPAVLCALGFTAALAAVVQYSLRAYVPGSLEAGGFTLANFAALMKPLYAWVFLDTVWICFSRRSSRSSSDIRSLRAGACEERCAQVHHPGDHGHPAVPRRGGAHLFLDRRARQQRLVNSMLLKAGLTEQPLQLMFTRFGVVTALVHVTLPVMVIMLAAALSHIDRDYERAAASLGAGPIRAFLTVTLPLSMPGIIAGVTTAFAWTQRFRNPAADRRRSRQHDREPRLPTDLPVSTFHLPRACRSPGSFSRSRCSR